MGNKLEQMFGGRDKSTIPYSTGFAYNINCDWELADAQMHMSSIVSSLETDIFELAHALWDMDKQYEYISRGIPSSKDIEHLQRLINWVHEVAKRYETHLSTYWDYRENIGFSNLTSTEKALMNNPKYVWDKEREEKLCGRN